MPDPEVSAAVVAFLGHGRAHAPLVDEDAVGGELVGRVRTIVSEALGTEVDWSSL